MKAPKITKKTWKKIQTLRTKIFEEVFEISPYDYQKDVSDAIIWNALLDTGDSIAIEQCRQCIEKGSIVHTRDGTLSRIETLPNSWKTGEKNIYEVKINGGASIRCSKEHPLLTKDGWEKVSELKRGDEVKSLYSWDKFGKGIIPYEYKKYINMHSTETVEGNFKMTNELAELLGFLVTDGYISNNKQSFKFTNTRKEYLDRVKYLVNKNFKDINIKEYTKGNGKDLLFTTGENSRFNSLKDFIRIMKMNNKFPTATNYFTKEQICYFLKGVWCGDGYIVNHPTKNEFGLACGNNLIYAQYFRELLNKLGLRGRVTNERMKLSTKTFHRITLNGYRNKLAFLNTIGEIPCKPFNNKIKKLYKIDTEKEIDGEISYYRKILSIKKVGYNETYDLEISNKGWFISGGVIAHNSGKTEGVTLTTVFLLAFYYQLKKSLGFWAPKELQIGIFAPQQEQAKTDFVRIKKYLNKLKEKAPNIEFTIAENNGNTISLVSEKFPQRIVYCFSASPTSNTESKTLNIIIYEEAHELLDSKIDNTIAPMGMQTNAMSIYIGTAGYKKCRFHKMLTSLPKKNLIRIPYERAIKERNKKYKQTKNPIHLNYKKKIKNIIREIGIDSDAFKTQYALKWVLERGQFTTEEALEKLEIEQDMPFYVGPGEICYAGIDWGKHKDGTVVTFIDENYNIRGWLELIGDDYNSQILTIVSAIKNVFPGCRTIHCDSTGNQDQGVDVLRGRLQEAGISANVIPINFTAGSKDAMYKHLWSLMHDKVIPLPDGSLEVMEPAKLTYPKSNCKEKDKFLIQLLQLQKEIKRGMWSCHHPDGNYHDDYPDSIALACLAFGGLSKPYNPVIS